MRKAFGLSFIKQVLLVLACLYGAQFFCGVFAAVDCGPPPVAVGPMGGVASSDVDSTDVSAAKLYNSCMVKARANALRTLGAIRLLPAALPEAVHARPDAV
jgi:hypothetical protein